MHRIKGDRRQLHGIDLPLRPDGVIGKNIHDIAHEVEIFPTCVTLDTLHSKVSGYSVMTGASTCSLFTS